MSVVKRAYAKWLVVPAMAAMLVTGCKDDDDDDDVLGPDAGDAGSIRVDGGMDGSTPSGDAGWPDLKVIPAAISATGHDRFFGVAYDATGNIFAVGQTSEGVTTTDDSSIVLAKFTPAGVLDTTFGGGKGYVVHNLTVGGQSVEAARGIVIQNIGANAGKIVIAGEAEHAAVSADAGMVARDSDIVLARFLPSGDLDTTFGTPAEPATTFGKPGTVRLDLGIGVEISTPLDDGGVQRSLAGADTAWSLSQASDGKLVIHGATRATGNAADGGVRTDNDYTLIRLTENGALDTTFAGTGYVRTDVGQVNGSARSATILPDNSIVAAGYTTSTVLRPTRAQQPVLYKVRPDGTPDPTFATTDQVTTPGVWHDFARSDLMSNAEAYGAALQGDKFVTVGYGPAPAPNASSTDWVFFRFNADGTQDKTFGTQGETFLDVAKFSDNGRAITTLPDNRILAVGGGRPGPAQPAAASGQPLNVDGMIGVLTPNGLADTTFAPGGYRRIDWGDADFLHACAVAPGNTKQVAIVGAAGGGRQLTDDDDAVLLLWNTTP